MRSCVALSFGDAGGLVRLTSRRLANDLTDLMAQTGKETMEDEYDGSLWDQEENTAIFRSVEHGKLSIFSIAPLDNSDFGLGLYIYFNGYGF